MCPDRHAGGDLAKGGDVTLYYDGTSVRTGRVEATQPLISSAVETTDRGCESGATVTPDCTAAASRFTGRINWVQIYFGDDDHDHFIDPEERLRFAMSVPWAVNLRSGSLCGSSTVRSAPISGSPLLRQGSRVRPHSRKRESVR